MDTRKLKPFAQQARRQLMDIVSTRLGAVLSDNSSERREHPKAVASLERQIKQLGKDQVIERVSYIWFNRLTALRYMDVNRYTRMGIVSPAEGQTQPEILAEAKMGHMDAELVPADIQDQVTRLLQGDLPSRQPQAEAYRLLVVAACNYWHKAMPFLFQRIEDYTELLMPEDLLSNTSIVAKIREVLTPEVCRDVEVIGWLYQFYISEKKVDVYAGLKKNKKVTAENLPAATQLFTPNWIVRYLVENSLGRLWMLNRPNSRLISKMEYYIKPEQPEADFLKISSPEEIKVCDPACGSGHMLVYAFDLLHHIYEEEGYEPSEIPALILQKNLYGIEIDERAGELAALALSIKARQKNRRFFRKPVQPNICVLENIRFNKQELEEYKNVVGREIFSVPLQITLEQFEDAAQLGSLIRPEIEDVERVQKTIQKKNIGGQIFLSDTHQKVLKALKQADYLNHKYHVVVANPPYLGRKGLNGNLASWAKDNYPRSNADLFAMFIERGLEMVPKLGYSAMVTMQSWMFLSTYEKLREDLVSNAPIQCMTHMANMVMGIAFGTNATVWKKGGDTTTPGAYCYVEYEDISNANVPVEFPPRNSRNNKAGRESGWLFCVPSADFEKIPGSPIAYWLTVAAFDAFKSLDRIGQIAKPRQGMSTNDNTRFLRRWHEICLDDLGLNFHSSAEADASGKKWFPYNKGGDFRKWYGNNEFVVNWLNDGAEIKNWLVNNPQDPKTTHWSRRIINTEFYFREGITWTFVSSSSFGVRYTKDGFLFDVGGSSLFPPSDLIGPVLCGLAAKTAIRFLGAVNPTLNFQAGNIAAIPMPLKKLNIEYLKDLSNQLIVLVQNDWDSYETSWDFTILPLINTDYLQPTLNNTYKKIRAHWLDLTQEMKQLEEENNRIFIEAYGLQDELTPEAPLQEITLTCNPHYRYGGKRTDEELEQLLLADTMKEFISYGVGCMFGRYSLDKPGLILANQGETAEDYYRQVPEPSFLPDDTNVIPMLDDYWFTDDITERFRNFLRVTFGEKHYQENLAFIEQALGKDIRKYFIRDFYNDHVRRFKKRPIYWLFSSPKGSFNALVYMHRYRPDTVGVVLSDYLREFRTKLLARMDHLKQVEASVDASKGEKTKALKQIAELRKTIEEIDTYEKDVLYPLATRRLEIDLDDGVKVNYAKFGKALKNIQGL